MEPKSRPCVFLGYSKNQSVYLCLDLVSQKIFVSRHVMFDETKFPFEHVTADLTQTESNSTHRPTATASECPNSSSMSTAPPSTTDTLELTCATHAIKDTNWKKAMMEELKALRRNNTWELVHEPSDRTVVGCKWVFRVKRNADGSVASLVVKPVTIRLVLSIAIANGWSFKQMDVNNAFLQGDLTDEVYMKQPPVLYDKKNPEMVCKLKKAIYGLKQAPRAWYCALSNFLISFGFKNSIADTSLFIYQTGSILAYLLVYVDDLILTGNDGNFLQRFSTTLANKFSIKDLVQLHCVLGIEVLHTPKGLFLSQSKYIADILNKANMVGAKECTNPLSVASPLKLHDGTVNKLSQFMHKPSTLHLQALKIVLRYLKGTIQHGFLLSSAATTSLKMYTDSDWASDADDRRSTSAYIVYHGSNPISWCFKKQKTVARSSNEAEYRAIALGVSELTWIQSLLNELQVKVPKAPTIFCDNLSATYTCANPVFHTRMKHLALDYFFVREKVSAGVLNIKHIPTQEELADALTKPLSTEISEVDFQDWCLR
ncbi:Reverse transcriptase, RNA-dependent DNA polymerase [Corchorus capsularis]|uniref:Reverse transcriptase, RNA-dependent DNA polymerase n=1 Tax=Corchorus capsularis TaxID=210143 RepID=A0A1R3IZE6_COCAP|nr:Reverse transcriptase, RNA-dependent DNA polymerase [Corchorus capsularis]